MVSGPRVGLQRGRTAAECQPLRQRELQLLIDKIVRNGSGWRAELGFSTGLMARDPDGHALLLIEQRQWGE
jgi:hypothetical protein